MPANSRSSVGANGNRLEIRNEQNAEGGTLAFWTEAVQKELVQARGYRLASVRDVVTANGLAGKELSFTVERNLVKYGYLVTLFVDGARLLVAEAGGEEKALLAELTAIRTALAALR